MSFQVLTTIEKFPQKPFQFVPYFLEENATFGDFPVLGSLLTDLKHFWQAKGPCLEVRHVTTGRKVGSFTFGCVLKDTNTKIVAVEELKRSGGRLSLLVVALDCALTGGVVCVFDIFGSKVLRAVRIGEKITNIHVIDHACDTVFPESSPLQYFDGLLAVGTLGGNVFLLDLCKQICENALENFDLDIRGEVNNCQMVLLNKQKIHNIKKYIEKSVEREEHLAIHLNVVLDSSSEHFVLKGEKGDDRVHVNRAEAEVSALFYAKQIASLLIGYNFGSFQVWDLRSLDLLYTSPLCEDIIPVTNFTIQEPADDPKSVCYIWVSYSHNLLYGSGLPYAVMYAFYFHGKNFVNKFGTLYEDFQHCSIRFQLALGDTLSGSLRSSAKGGICLGLQSINKNPTNKDLSSLELCLISWLFWDSDKMVNTAVLLFDLNQWYKEQMPASPSWMRCSNYIIKNKVDRKLMSIKMDRKSLCQFMGSQRPEEHFCPTSLSFDLWAISEHSIFKIHNKGHQKFFLDRVLNDQHLALVNPVNYTEEIVNLGLVPLFYDIHHNSQNADYQRELLLNVALEQKLVGWLCKVTSEVANNAFSAAGLTLYNMLQWAFQRAVTIKNACDKYCVPLFDYSGIKLDNNILGFISCGTHQIRNLCSFYRYISSKLLDFVADREGLLEEQRSLENVVVYFEVLLWMVSIGLLPEFQPKSEARSLIGVPYLVQNLTEYYNQKRVQLQLASKDTFADKDCLIFIDNLINSRAIVDGLRQKWQEDGGSGLYPPPSLQSLLRTYLLDGPDLVFKHSLVTYTFLDIAMTLDPHNEVIKLLLKFPQIFNLSQSNIKIVQGFWRLDHDDYESALDCILDASVSSEDLKPWHHSVMMKTLLTQDRSGLALWYLQVRKPAIQEEKDLFTVISLLVSKNLLDEAFEFRLRHKGPNDYDLLNHIFNECNKNDLLHSLLCRNFNVGEEKAFLKYLQSTKNPKCEDLKVFYYLLRSRFLEAFDAYSLSKKRQPDSQGLIGQREASTADNLVQMYKSLLPDVSSKLVELVRKERTNLWKEVAKPTPLSVFVHNAKDKVQYKSSVIFAALSKAKQTFNDSVNETKNNEVVTEETPFLRTPLVLRNKTHERTPLLKYKVIGDNEDYDGPSPPKKLKLSPRASKSSPNRSRNLSLSNVQSQLSTPIILRHKRRTMDNINDTAFLPQGILKSTTILESSIFNENWLEASARRSALGLSPRTSVRSALKSHVQFSGVQSSSGSSSFNNTSLIENLENETKNSSGGTVEDVFYSPEHSFDKIEFVRDDEERNKSVKDNEEKNQLVRDDEEKVLGKSVHQVKEKLSFDDSVIVDEQPVTLATPVDVASDRSTIRVEENTLKTKVFESPKCRKSYRKSLVDTPSPVRFSARLAKKSSEENSTTETSEESTSNEIKSLPSSPTVQKLRGRRSLSRAVMENNLLKSQMLSLEKPQNDSGKLQISCSSISDMSFNDSSLYDFLGENQNPADSDTSFETDNVEVVSKVTEVSHLEIHRESLRSKETGSIVSTKETKEEFHSKTVEKFEDDDDNIDLQEDIVDKDAKDLHLNKEKSIESEEDKEEEAINIYEDLSSASEDAKEVLQNITKEKELKYDKDPTEQENPAEVFENDIEMLDISNEIVEDIPETEKAFIDCEEVIEIDSSSEEECSPQKQTCSSHNSSISDSEGEAVVLEDTEGLSPSDKSDPEEEEASNQSVGSVAEDWECEGEKAQQELEEECSRSERSSLAELAEQDQEEESSNQKPASEYGSRDSEDVNCDEEIPKHNLAEKSSNSSNGTDDSYDSDARIVKHVVGDDSSGDVVGWNSQYIEEEILDQAIAEDNENNQEATDNAVREVEENSVNTADKDVDCSEHVTSEEDENSDVDESLFVERIITARRMVRQAGNSESEKSDSSEDLQTPDEVVEANLKIISPQHVATSSEPSEISPNTSEETSPMVSRKQSRSIQCTLADTVFDKSILLTEIDSEEAEEPRGKRSISLQCSLHTPNAEEPLETSVIKLRTVKRTYGGKGRKGSNDEDVVVKASDEDVKVKARVEEHINKEYKTPNVKDPDCSEPTTIKLKTVKRTYGGRKGTASTVEDVDDTPTRINSKIPNVRLFDNEDVEVQMDEQENTSVQKGMEENVVMADMETGNMDENVAHEESANNDKDMEENIVAQEDNANIDKDIEENIVTPDEDIEESEKNLVVNEEIVNIDKNREEIDGKMNVDQENTSIEKDDKKLDSNSEQNKEIDNDRQATPPPLETITEEKKQPEAAPIRMTRRRSMLQSQESSECSETTKSEKGDLDVIHSQSTISSQSSDRRSQKQDLVKQKEEGTTKQKSMTKRKSRKILSDIDAHAITDLDETQTTQKEESKTDSSAKSKNAKRTTRTSKSRAASLASVEATVKPRTKRTRSYSVDQPVVTQKKNSRTRSVDSDITDMTDEKRHLQVVLTPIDQTSGYSTPKKSKAKSSSRISSRKRSTDEKTLPVIEEIDPLNLLDKVDFKGQPDPDEAKVYEEDTSLPSSPESLSRQTRAASVVSNASSIKSRLRRPSADSMSVISGGSDSPSPPKKNKKKDVEEASAKSVRLTRSKANSVVSLQSNTSSTRNTRARSRKPSVLEDIQEEKGSDEERKGDEKSNNVKRRGRKRKE